MVNTKKAKHSSKTKTLATTTNYKRKKTNKSAANADGDEPRRAPPSRRVGPRLPGAFRRELEALNPNAGSDEEDEDVASDDAGGVTYEYDDEDDVAEEEAGKNRRYDRVDKAESFAYDSDNEKAVDVEVPSDEGEIDDDGDDNDDDDEEEGRERHLRMLESITGMPKQAFGGDNKKSNSLVDMPVQQGEDSNRQVTIHDLLDSLQGKPGHSSLRKRLQQQEQKPMLVQAPLPRVERERVERKVVYDLAKKEVTKWEPLVKRNREAPTLFIEDDLNLGYNTIGAIANGFEPRTAFEKKMRELVNDPEISDSHKNDGARILEHNAVSFNDVKDRQDKMAKMRSILFRHEMKAKRIKKIKSRTYHRQLKKEKVKAGSAALEMDPEAAKELARKQEFERAEERMTQKHKNQSKWAKRLLWRGLDVQDEGTRAALAAQLNQHALLTRKMKSMNADTSSSDESSDEDEDEDEDESMLLNRAKEKTLKVLGEDDELPKSGVFALPFMERALNKRKEESNEEARRALEEYEDSMGHFDDMDNAKENHTTTKLIGKRAFGPSGNATKEPHKKPKLDDDLKNSDSEEDPESAEYVDVSPQAAGKVEDIQIGTALLDDEQVTAQNALLKSFDDISKDPGPKTTYDVAIFAANSWKKVKGNPGKSNSTASAAVKDFARPVEDNKKLGHKSDSDSEKEMDEGFRATSDTMASYELPSQADLIRQAFAGDDVEAEFEKDKMEVLDEENPEPEKPVLIPGWGQWTNVQKKKGLPAWMLEEHETAKRKREESLKKRKDAKLKHVIISENIDKKAEKLLTKALPFPYTSKEVYEQSIRMPIGPDYNPAISVSALNRPSVVKKPGVIIKPIQYEEVDPHDKPEEPKRVIQRATPNPKAKKGKSTGGVGKQARKGAGQNGR